PDLCADMTGKEPRLKQARRRLVTPVGMQGLSLDPRASSCVSLRFGVEPSGLFVNSPPFASRPDPRSSRAAKASIWASASLAQSPEAQPKPAKRNILVETVPVPISLCTPRNIWAARNRTYTPREIAAPAAGL